MKPAEGSICILVKAGVQWNSLKENKKKGKQRQYNMKVHV
jgi:hypothetical protein